MGFRIQIWAYRALILHCCLFTRYIQIPYFSPHVGFPCWASTKCSCASVCELGQKYTLENHPWIFLAWNYKITVSAMIRHRATEWMFLFFLFALTGRAHCQRQVAFLKLLVYHRSLIFTTGATMSCLQSTWGKPPLISCSLCFVCLYISKPLQ